MLIKTYQIALKIHILSWFYIEIQSLGTIIDALFIKYSKLSWEVLYKIKKNNKHLSLQEQSC